MFADTKEHEHRVERYGGKRIRGHAVDLAVDIGCDDGNAGCELADRLTKYFWIN